MPRRRSDSRPRRASRRWRAARFVVHAALVLLQLAVVVAAVGISVARSHYDLTPIAVQSGSMEPTLPVRSLIFVRDVPAEDVRVGDIITFDPTGPVPRTTHRVVEREQIAGRWYFLTKGDANPAVDDWRRGRAEPKGSEQLSETWRKGVTYTDGHASRVVGHVPHLGRVTSIGSVPGLREGLLATPFIVVALWMLWVIWRPVAHRRARHGELVPRGQGAEEAPAQAAPRRDAA